MNTNFSKPIFISAVLILITCFLFFACNREIDKRIPPTLTLKTGAGYISVNTTVGTNDTLLVGVDVAKTEDALKTFNVSYAFDGAPSTTTNLSETLQGNDQTVGFSRNVQIITRNVTGSEVWTFTVTDLDGNIAQKSITLTVN